MQTKTGEESGTVVSASIGSRGGRHPSTTGVVTSCRARRIANPEQTNPYLLASDETPKGALGTKAEPDARARARHRRTKDFMVGGQWWVSDSGFFSL